MVKTTRQQRKALFKILQRDFPSYVTPTLRMAQKPCPNCSHAGDMVKMPSVNYRKLRASVLLGPDCIIVPRWNMWLGIEPDGYTHS